MKKIACAAFMCCVVQSSTGQTFTDVSTLIDSVATVFSVGASIVDANSDGLKDIYRFQGLYLQQPDGTFKESTEEAGLNNPDGTSAEGNVVFGGIFSDYDNDGYVDIFFEDLSEFSRMFRGRGDGSFYHANEEANVHIQSVLQGSAWADFDGDGLVDLFAGGDGQPSALYMNDGDGTFTNASANVAYSPLRNIYGVAAADFDNDGDIDIYIASCSQDPVASTNLLFENDGSGNFTDVAGSLGLDDDGGGWGVVWLDVNNDGWLDLFVANMTVSGAGIETRPGFNRLYVSNGAGGYSDLATTMGVAGHMDDSTIGATAGDFNNDGFIDIAVANSSGPNQGIQLYINNGGSGFTHYRELNTGSSRTQAITSGDVNGDGWIDIVSPGFQGDFLFYNDPGSMNHVTVALVGVASNRAGIGARVHAYAPELHQIREISAGNGMTSQSDGLEAHFGMGAHTQVDSVVVEWPSGQKDVVADVQAGERIIIVEGSGTNPAPSGFALLEPANGDMIIDAPDSIRFRWEHAIDVDGDPLTYTLKLLEVDTGDMLTYSTADTLLSVDRSEFTQNAEYRWTVDVTDGSSVRRSWHRNSVSIMEAAGIAQDTPLDERFRVDVFPNPSSGTAILRITTVAARTLSLQVVDITGRVVMHSQINGISGSHEVRWEGHTPSGDRLGPGLYLYRVTDGQAVVTGKMIRM